MLEFLKEIKEKKWSKIDNQVRIDLLKDIQDSDYRIFPFILRQEIKNTENNTVKTLKTTWMLPFSVVRERLMKCPHCSESLLQTCMEEIRLADLYQALSSDDEVTKDSVMENLKEFDTMYQKINKEGGNNE